jgi:hypothetical protein
MKNFLTRFVIKHLAKNDFIIISRTEVAKDKGTFMLITEFLSYLNKYNKKALLTGHQN